MSRVYCSLLAVAAVLASGSLVDANTGICAHQSKCLAPSIGSCVGGKRKVCMLFRPGFNGCGKGWTYAFPDICSIEDASEKGKPGFPFNRRWAGRFCHTVRTAGTLTFAVRDDTACTGSSTDFSHYSSGQLAAVAHCRPAPAEICDTTQYTEEYFTTNPTFRNAKPAACEWTIKVGSCSAATNTCCQSMDASCLACQSGFSVEDYCLAHPDADNCPPPKKVCCMSMDADCLACSAGQTVEEYCKAHPDADGCSTVMSKFCAGHPLEGGCQ
jgi:hypothetical protein